MNIHVTPLAEWDALAFVRNHDFHPKRFFPMSFLVQVCQMSYMVHVEMRLAPTYFAGVVE